METVSLYKKPIRIIEDTDAFVEMTENEMAFICGLIKKFEPHKIVEVEVRNTEIYLYTFTIYIFDVYNF